MYWDQSNPSKKLLVTTDKNVLASIHVFNGSIGKLDNRKFYVYISLTLTFYMLYECNIDELYNDTKRDVGLLQ